MSGNRIASLNVTKSTTAADLQILADKLGAGDRLRGRKVEGGYELYAKTGKPGLWSRMAGTRGHARDAIKMAFNNTERNIGGKTLDNVRTAMDVGVRSKDIKGGTLKVLAAAAGRTGLRGIAKAADNRGPSLEKVLGSSVEETTSTIAAKIETMRDSMPESFSEDNIAKLIADELSEGIDRAKQDSTRHGSLDKLALSNGSALKFDLRKAIPYIDSLGDTGREIMDKAFNRLSPSLMRNQEQTNGTIMLDGVSFTKGAKLGEGGFGVVHEYTSTQDNTKIALKTALNFNPADRSSIEEFKREANVHRAATRGNPGNVVNFRGAVKMSDGQIGVALSIAKHGSAQTATDNISEAVRDRKLASGDALNMRISLLKDMAAGLNNLSNAKGGGIVHYDFKRDNVFIDEDGVGLVGDFGLSAKSDRFDFGILKEPVNKMQASPELIKLRGKPQLNLNDSVKTVVTNRFKGLDKAQKKDLVANCKRDVNYVEKRVRNAEISAEKIDAWAFGYAAFVTIFGREPLTAISDSIDDDHIARLTSFDGNVRAIDVSVPDDSRTDWSTQTAGSFAGSTGDRRIDNLINGLMHPDPEQRMTVKDASEKLNAIMTDQQSAAARRDLAAFLSGNPVQGAQTGPTQPQPAAAPATQTGGNTTAAAPPASDLTQATARQAMLDAQLLSIRV